MGISLMISDAENLFMHLLFICVLWENICLGPLPVFKSGFYFFELVLIHIWASDSLKIKGVSTLFSVVVQRVQGAFS